jgi:hypothetical protein
MDVCGKKKNFMDSINLFNPNGYVFSTETSTAMNA